MMLGEFWLSQERDHHASPQAEKEKTAHPPRQWRAQSRLMNSSPGIPCRYEQKLHDVHLMATFMTYSIYKWSLIQAQG
jgi:hypothetical protein